MKNMTELILIVASMLMIGCFGAKEVNVERGDDHVKESDVTNANQIVSCEINGIPMLIPADVCEKLQQKYADKIEETGNTIIGDVSERPEINIKRLEISIEEADTTIPDDISAPQPGREIDAKDIEIPIEKIDTIIPDDVGAQPGREIIVRDLEASDKKKYANIQLYISVPEAIHRITTALIEIDNGKIIGEKISTSSEEYPTISIELPEKEGVYKLKIEASYSDNQVIRISRYINYITDPNIYTQSEEISQVNNQIDQLTNELEENSHEREENARRTEAEERQGAQDTENVHQLEATNAVLDEVEEIYSDSLRLLFDSLSRVTSRAIRLETVLFNLRNRIQSLENALTCCHEQLRQLQQSQARIGEQLDNLGERQGLQIARQRRSLRRSMDALSRQIMNTDNQCENFYELLREARADLSNTNNQENAHQAHERMLNNSISELCRQIKNILEGLEQWCEDNPQDSSTIAELIEQFMDECPQNANELRSYWRNWNQILESKHQLENQYSSSAEDHRQNVDRLREERSRLEEAQQQMEERLNQLEQELREARDRQRQDLEAQREEARDKAVCLRLLSENATSESGESNVLADIAAAYEEFANTTGMVSEDLSGLLDRINDFNARIDEIRGELERVRTLFNGILDDPTNESRTEAFAEVLEIAGEIGERIPGVGEMLGFYAEAYSVAIGLIMQLSDLKLKAIKPLVDAHRVTGCPQPGWENKSMDQILEDQWNDFLSSPEGVVVRPRLTNEEQAKLEEYFEQKTAVEILNCCLRRIMDN